MAFSSSTPATAFFNNFSQIILIQNSYVGAAIAAGLLLAAPISGIAAALASCLAILLALLGKQPAETLHKGLLGYNPVLTAIALIQFFPSHLGIAITLLGVIASYYVTSAFKRLFPSLAALTAPFVLTTWFFYFISMAAFPSQPRPLALSALVDIGMPIDWLSGTINSVGEIFLQDNILFSLIVLVAVTLLKWQKGALTVFSVIVCMVFMSALDEVDRFYSGLLAYNVVLTALALDELIAINHLAIRRLLKTLLYLSVSLLLTKIGFVIAGIGLVPALTAPFVVATWLILAYEKCKNKTAD